MAASPVTTRRGGGQQELEGELQVSLFYKGAAICLIIYFQTASIVSAILSFVILAVPSFMISLLSIPKSIYAIFFFISSVPFSFTLNSLFASDKDVSLANMFS